MRGFGFQGSGFGKERPRASGVRRQAQRRRRSLICNLQFVRLVAVLISGLLLASAARANEKLSIAAVRVGFGGNYRVGFWTPVEVTLKGASENVTGRLSLSVPDGDGVRNEIMTEPLEVPAGGEVQIATCVKFGSLQSTLALRFGDESRAWAEETYQAGGDAAHVEFPKAFASTQSLVLMLGTSIGVEDAIGRAVEGAERTNVVGLADASQLPEEWLGYEGVDKLVVGPAPPGLETELKEGSKRLAALDRWLREGGRLVLALGTANERYLSAGSPWARFLPGRFEEVTALSRTTAVEMYGGVPLRWPRGQRRALQVARLSDVKGHVDLGEGDFPLIVRSAYTFGEVTFSAFDFTLPPVVDWSGRKLVVKRLMGQRGKAAAREEAGDVPPPATHLGLVDLSAQLRGALDQFPGISLAPFWAVAALAAIYIALVGPVDFLLLRTLLRRMELTWITFPLVVVAFCGGIYWAAGKLKSDRVSVNQIDLVDIDVAAGRARGTTWFNLFSPATTTYNLSLKPHLGKSSIENGDRSLDAGSQTGARSGGGTGPIFRPPDVVLSWQGLPGNVLGGMEHPVAAPSGVARPYRFSADRSQVNDAPVPIWSSKSFVGRWQSEAGASIDADLVSGRDEVLDGTLVNRLDAPLSRCLLVAGRWAWQIEELAPGRLVRVRPGEQRDLVALLKDFKLVREGIRDDLIQMATPYDPASFNPRSILQQMMFYDAADGRQYTGLLNRYQRYIDLSGHLDLGQAILWGECERRAADVCRDGQPFGDADNTHTTFYRFLIPLKQR